MSNTDDEDESGDELAEDSERDDPDERRDNRSQVEWIALNSFKDLYQVAPIYKLMHDFGQNIVPLSVVGMFLNYVGNHLLFYIHTILKRKVFYPSHRVVSI